ncbi:cadherin domain-containing protein, partial [Spirosoma endbachense]
MFNNYLARCTRWGGWLVLVLLLIGESLQATPPTLHTTLKPVLLRPLAAVSYSQPTNPFPSLSFGARRVYYDVDADGDQDMLYQDGNVSGVGISLIRNNGNGTFGSPINANGSGTFTSGPLNNINFTNITLTSIFIVDYDNDGDEDLVETVNDDVGRIVRNNGNGTSTDLMTSPFPSLSFGARRVYYDVDADGDQDMLYQDGNVSGVGISLIRNNGNGTFGSPINANGSGTFTSGPLNNVTFTNITLSSLFIVDYDDDGDQDLVETVNDDVGRIVRNNGNGTSTDLTTSPFPSLSFGARRFYFDVDSDGDQDMLYQDGNVSGVGISLILNNGNGTFGSPINANGSGTFTSGPLNNINFANITLTSIFVVDYDNDGDPDLVETVNDDVGRVIRQEGSQPKITSTSPADNATGVNPATNLTLTFDRSVSKGNGNLYLVRTSDNVIVETVPVGNAKVTGSGTTWVLDPSTTLANLTAYALRADEEVFIDTDGRVFAGIFTNALFNFTTGTANSAPTDIALSASTVAENQPGGTAVGTLSTTDPDVGQSFSYSLVTGGGSTNNASFQLVGSQLQTAATFNYEAQSSYSIRIRTTDNGSPALTFEKSFTISVTNVNEPPTISPQSFTVNENTPNTTPVGTVAASDPDAGTTLSYSIISGNTNGAFALSGNSLQVANSAALNFEVTPTFSLSIGVSDGALTNYALITITISNVNEAPSVANAIPPQSATVGSGFSYLIPANTFTDTETPASLTLSVSS